LGPTPNFFGIALGKKTRAAAIWMGKVGQDQVWDHKKYLFANFRGAWQKQGEYDYYYDIWSNVHYGYVGVIAGVPEALLLDAAGVEQIGSDTVRWARDGTGESHGPQLSGDLSEGLRAFDDAPDRISVGIGVKLAKQYPKGGVTGEMIKTEVLAVAITDWGAGIQAHECR
ncbi:MAG: polymorphic toxin type 44 domain-containing protein, partial [Pseudomonas marincola]|uniref:polymorphic toxin type 44 domain-containing protein n=1 Tax=Pseudomonas marincola TaxID=437900 RepID=UPI0030035756